MVNRLSVDGAGRSVGGASIAYCDFPLQLANDPGREGCGVHCRGRAASGDRGRAAPGDHSCPDVYQIHEHERRRAPRPPWATAVFLSTAGAQLAGMVLAGPGAGMLFLARGPVPAAPDGVDKPSSERSHGTDDLPPEGDLAAAIGIKAKTGQFPFAILSMVGQDPPGGVACHSARQVDHEVGIFGHHLLLCSTSPMIQSATEENRYGRAVPVGHPPSAQWPGRVGPSGAEQGPDQANA